MKIFWLALLCALTISCSRPQLEAPTSKAVSKPVPRDWITFSEKRQRDIESYIAANKVSYDRFANFPVSQTEGVPFLFLKLLPIVAPQFWPDDDNFLSVIGLYNDARQPDYPIARGIGFTGLSRDLSKKVVDRASFTCGGCHIGRVRKPDGTLQYLDGGINTEFNVVGYRKRMVETLDFLTAGIKGKKQQDKILVEKFLDALDWVEQKRQGYFYKNYRFEERHFDIAYEKQQIELFKEQADKIIPAYAERIRDVYRGWRVLVEKNYANVFDDMMTGYPGTEDAIGFNTVDAYLNFKKKTLLSIFAGLALAREPGVTDIMAVWDQQKRNPRWNDSKDDLIDGGGQWNGHIPLLIYKNIAAQGTLGVGNIDIAVSAFSEVLLEKLPAPAYPFNVNVELANKGKELFQQNCVECHRDNNGKVYRNIHTNLGRAEIASRLITTAAVSSFTEVCGVNTTIEMFGQPAKPCASYKGVSLKGKEHFAMTAPGRHDGYNALPLTGIWAQAPHLHNGSVPTIYHLLVPDERPDVFIKSQLGYDQQKLGFEWEKVNEYKEGYRLDTTQARSIGHQGHEKDVVMEGKTFRLNWSHDKASAMALIEYMKTL